MNKKPVVILIDIETSPNISYLWGTYQQNSLKVLENSKIISVSWKELDSAKINVKALVDYKSYKKGIINDEQLVKEIWKVLDKADVVVGHHSDAFDLKKLNARFVYYGLNAPSAYKTVDTKKVASKYFKFDGNSLNALSGYFGLGQKVNNGGFELWVRCMAGDMKAWKLMKDYNKQDVLLLEKLYLKLRPFINNHPNLNLVTDTLGESCPSCQSRNMQKRGFSITKTGRKQRFQCGDCGSWSSGPFTKVRAIGPLC